LLDEYEHGMKMEIEMETAKVFQKLHKE